MPINLIISFQFITRQHLGVIGVRSFLVALPASGEVSCKKLLGKEEIEGSAAGFEPGILSWESNKLNNYFFNTYVD